jgi:predicted phage terminase large subunit-like protein
MDKKFEQLIARYDVHCNNVRKATQVKLGESSEEKQKRILKLEEKYTRWYEYYFPHYAKVKCADYHQALANKIIRNNKIRLLAEIYRSGAKSVHVCMGIPLYLYLVEKDLFFMLLIGETDMKAKKLLSDIQAELEYNERLKNDYGNKFKRGDWADGNFYTADGVRFMSLGFDQSARGIREGANRPDFIAVDDVDSKKHINNNRIMGESLDKITEDIFGCFDATDKGAERFVYSNNNFHKNSITNRLKAHFVLNIKKDKEEGVNNSDYYVLTITAVKDLVNFEPTWPAKTTAEYWRKKYTRNSRGFKREYMHMHVLEGKIFKDEYMQWKPMLRLSQYDGLAMYGDLSYKDQGDFKGMVLMGKIKRELHIIYTFCRQTSRKKTAEWVYNLYEDKNLSGQNIKYKIEGLFAMDEFLHEFDNEGDVRGYHIPVVADKKGKANKFDRIESIEGFFERRWIFFNEKEKGHVDQQELIDQFISFEKGSQSHDDGPDCVYSAIDELNRVTYIENFEPRIIDRTQNFGDFDY